MCGTLLCPGSLAYNVVFRLHVRGFGYLAPDLQCRTDVRQGALTTSTRQVPHTSKPYIFGKTSPGIELNDWLLRPIFSSRSTLIPPSLTLNWMLALTRQFRGSSTHHHTCDREDCLERSISFVCTAQGEKTESALTDPIGFGPKVQPPRLHRPRCMSYTVPTTSSADVLRAYYTTTGAATDQTCCCVSQRVCYRTDDRGLCCPSTITLMRSRYEPG
ncbi:hypothetical protein N656DRAFT_211312 [Canariomyces notabilis]|uniref:Uncharacterized protein n=1 Tax=Canariomyces notabilis TaxID=2074819 RepID=A0AAN6TAX2_9PEZI|nr:hypothetical protein N656DRAFT_211312 [Canariomyces arenarius]